MKRATSYREFWPLYLAEHRRPATRALHYFGTSLGLAILALALVTQTWWLVLVALFAGYAFAWLGHAFVEHNKPTTFVHPWWSFVSDFRVLGFWVAGRLEDELKRHGITDPDGAP
ncbi:MAG: DUF962 domain-containing protein [Kiloniellales bacterium]|nr:DUF962 domain-containing protein [Kiloniellales bacterium]